MLKNKRPGSCWQPRRPCRREPRPAVEGLGSGLFRAFLSDFLWGRAVGVGGVLTKWGFGVLERTMRHKE